MMNKTKRIFCVLLATICLCSAVSTAVFAQENEASRLAPMPEDGCAIVTKELPDASAGLNYRFGFEYAEEGLLWKADGLPAGLSLDENTGVISGKPISAGEFIIFVYATGKEKVYTRSYYFNIGHNPACGFSEDAPCMHIKHDWTCGYSAYYPEKPCRHYCGDGLCSYKPKTSASPCVHTHDDECGYREESIIWLCEHVCDGFCNKTLIIEGSPCTHVCNGDCDESSAGVCRHEHNEACGFRPWSTETVCGHDHVLSGCSYEVVAAAPCVHVHNEKCGFSEESEGVACDHFQHNDLCGYAPESEARPCQHVHDEKCGFSTAAPCDYVPLTVTADMLRPAYKTENGEFAFLSPTEKEDGSTVYKLLQTDFGKAVTIYFVGENKVYGKDIWAYERTEGITLTTLDASSAQLVSVSQGEDLTVSLNVKFDNKVLTEGLFAAELSLTDCEENVGEFSFIFENVAPETPIADDITLTVKNDVAYFNAEMVIEEAHKLGFKSKNDVFYVEFLSIPENKEMYYFFAPESDGPVKLTSSNMDGVRFITGGESMRNINDCYLHLGDDDPSAYNAEYAVFDKQGERLFEGMFLFEKEAGADVPDVPDDPDVPDIPVGPVEPVGQPISFGGVTVEGIFAEGTQLEIAKYSPSPAVSAKILESASKMLGISESKDAVKNFMVYSGDIHLILDGQPSSAQSMVKVWIPIDWKNSFKKAFGGKLSEGEKLYAVIAHVTDDGYDVRAVDISSTVSSLASGKYGLDVYRNGYGFGCELFEGKSQIGSDYSDMSPFIVYLILESTEGASEEDDDISNILWIACGIFGLCLVAFAVLTAVTLIKRKKKAEQIPAAVETVIAPKHAKKISDSGSEDAVMPTYSDEDVNEEGDIYPLPHQLRDPREDELPDGVNAKTASVPEDNDPTAEIKLGEEKQDAAIPEEDR